MCKLIVKNDMYNIVNRLKSIDKDYFVMRNTVTNKYELHHKGQLNTTYTLTLPFDSLDARTINYVFQSRRENFDKLIKEMEITNKKLENKEIENILDMAKYDLKNKLKYYENH